MTIEEMCFSKPWPSLCESMNYHPVPWVLAALVLVSYVIFGNRRSRP